MRQHGSCFSVLMYNFCNVQAKFANGTSRNIVFLAKLREDDPAVPSL